MSLLNNIVTTTTPRPPKVILYGGPGVGKTTFGAMIKDVIFLDVENGASNVRSQSGDPVMFARSPILKTWQEISQWILEIENAEHKFKCVVIDTLDWLLRRLEEFVVECDTGSKKTNEYLRTMGEVHGGFFKGREIVKNYLFKLLAPTIDRLTQKGITVIMLSHARQSRIIDAEGIASEKTAPDIPADEKFDLLSPIVEWVDVIGYVRKNSKGERKIILSETERIVAKNRYSNAVECDFNPGAFFDALKNKPVTKGN
jgi:hypothetical protein